LLLVKGSFTISNLCPTSERASPFRKGKFVFLLGTDLLPPNFRNIECGFKLPKIVEYLKSISPDLVLLQEVDIHCTRSGNVDMAVEVAMSVGLPFVYFACEGPTAGGIQGSFDAIVLR
jgi:hypothetical protein